MTKEDVRFEGQDSRSAELKILNFTNIQRKARAEELRGGVTQENFTRQRFEIYNKNYVVYRDAV